VSEEGEELVTTLEDLQISISQMSREELMQKVLAIRKSRRDNRESAAAVRAAGKKKATKKKKDPLEGIDPAALLEALLKVQGGGQ
jgi:hypothetical protein